MKTADQLIENCLLWITDLSVYRCRINKMQKYLYGLKNKFSIEGKYEKYIALTQSIQSASKKLQNIESKIVHTIKRNMNELYESSLGHWNSLDNENDLFDHMLFANKLVIELQRSLNDVVTNKESAEQSSLVVDMPVGKNVRMTKHSKTIG